MHLCENMTNGKRRWDPHGQFLASNSPLLYALNSFNNLFQEAEQQRKEAERQHEDEEGWVKVTRGSKVKARPHSEAVNKRTLQKEMRKKKRKELLNFYSWQHKNTQKERKQFTVLFTFLQLHLRTQFYYLGILMWAKLAFSPFSRYCRTKKKVWRRQTKNSSAQGTEKVQTLLNLGYFCCLSVC